MESGDEIRLLTRAVLRLYQRNNAQYCKTKKPVADVLGSHGAFSRTRFGEQLRGARFGVVGALGENARRFQKRRASTRGCRRWAARRRRFPNRAPIRETVWRRKPARNRRCARRPHRKRRRWRGAKRSNARRRCRAIRPTREVARYFAKALPSPRPKAARRGFRPQAISPRASPSDRLAASAAARFAPEKARREYARNLEKRRRAAAVFRFWKRALIWCQRLKPQLEGLQSKVRLRGLRALAF